MKTQGVARDVEVRNVSKTFETQKGEQVFALDDINIHIAASEFVSVVGTSGCGKSTLLRIVCGLYRPRAARCSSAANRCGSRAMTWGWCSRTRCCCLG